MPDLDRSPFASLLVAHRHRLGLSQERLAERTHMLHDAGTIDRAVSTRTIIALERASADRPRAPHPATVRALAAGLELATGTPEHEAFFAAAAGAPAPPVDPVPTRPDPDTAFIVAGREQQLGRLLAAIATIAGGVPDVALLTGGAGNGKTRLAEEACRRAIADHSELAVLWVACRSRFGTDGAQEPLRAMLGQILRDPLAEGGDDLPPENFRRLADRLPVAIRALTTSADALVGTLIAPEALDRPTLLDALDPGLRQRVADTAARRGGTPVTSAETTDAIWELLVAYARSGPLVLVIEDLHWADDATISTLNHLVDRLATHRLPLLLLGSIRTPEPANAPASLPRLFDLAAGRFPDAVVDLAAAIGGDAGRAFVVAAVAQIPDAGDEALVERLFERTGGWPLFVMSHLRQYPAGSNTAEAETIPAEIETVFARQLARLDDGERELIAAASVQGEEFLGQIAAMAAGVSLAALDTTLAGQVRPLGARASDPGLRRYRFDHAVRRDYIYSDTLSGLHRAHLHAATAAALIEVLGEQGHDAVEAIAYHLEHGGMIREAAQAWMRAADHLAHRASFEHLRAIYQHIRDMALEQIDPATHVQALIGVGNSERGIGRPRRARRILQQARRDARRLGLHAIHANALTSLGVLDFDEGKMAAGAARFAEAIDAYTLAGAIGEAGRATANLSFALHGMGRYDDARARALRAIELAREAADPAVLSSAEVAHANCWLDLGYYERAIQIYTADLERTESLGLTHIANLCLLNIALCHIEMARWDTANAALDRLGDPRRPLVERLRSVVAFNAGLIAEGRGDREEARRQYETARDVRLRLGQAPLVIDTLAGLLRLALADGERSGTRELAGEIESRLAEHGFTGIEHPGRLFVTLIEANRTLGNDARAARWLDDAIALLGERASRLADPNHRRSYLTRPTANRRVLEFASAAGIDGPARLLDTIRTPDIGLR